jgi:hypothetical protein
MTFEQFNHYQAKLLEEVVAMKDTKGKEYAHSEDRFANFNRLASGLGLSNVQIAWVYAMKHKDSIESYIKDAKTYSGETIRGRIVDLITYLTLIGGMIEEAIEMGEENTCEFYGIENKR